MKHEGLVNNIKNYNHEQVIDVSVKTFQVDCGSHTIGKLSFKDPIISNSRDLYLDDTMFSCIPINSGEFVPGYSIIFICNDNNKELLEKFYCDADAVMKHLDEIIKKPSS